MTATDELRRMLDERGVKWDGESYDGVTFWNDDTNLAVASDDRDGLLWVSQRLTPAQAIAATLGTGTCKVEYVSEWMGWHCKSCDTLWQGLRDQRPSFCMRCGRKVVDE